MMINKMLRDFAKLDFLAVIKIGCEQWLVVQSFSVGIKHLFLRV
jgi:hypothetical protein